MVVGQVERTLFRLLAQQGGKRRAMNAWLAYVGISKSEIARKMAVDMTVVLKYWARDCAPAERIEQMRRCGIPEFLLPRPSGRQPKGRLATQ